MGSQNPLVVSRRELIMDLSALIVGAVSKRGTTKSTGGWEAPRRSEPWRGTSRRDRRASVTKYHIGYETGSVYVLGNSKPFVSMGVHRPVHSFQQGRSPVACARRRSPHTPVRGYPEPPNPGSGLDNLPAVREGCASSLVLSLGAGSGRVWWYAHISFEHSVNVAPYV
jgi:hypothetical protein